MDRGPYLLALGEETLSARKDDVSVPVYLGDALQWAVSATLGHEEIVITVPPLEKDGLRSALKFPVAIAENRTLFLITHFPPRIWYGTKGEHPLVFQEVCDVEECGSVGVEFGAVS